MFVCFHDELFGFHVFNDIVLEEKGFSDGFDSVELVVGSELA